MRVPVGFKFAGAHAGIKPQRKDVALVTSDTPCSAAGAFTVNKAKAAPIQDAEPRLPADGIRAIVINSGNANALTGPVGLQDVHAVHHAFAKALKVPDDAVLSASTGVIGMRLPAQKVVDVAPTLAKQLYADPLPAAEAIMTTDTRVKMTFRALKLGGKDVTVSAIAKGSGMIAPQLATVIAVITTDCAISPSALNTALEAAMEPSFNNLTVDNDMSTNDVVYALANGRAGNPRITDPGPDYDAFAGALKDLCVELAREVASDGEGATKMLEVTVSGAPSYEVARDLSRSITGSSLVKAAMFGADPNWGRILATVGARAGSQGWMTIHPAAASVHIQGIPVYDREPQPFKAAALRKSLRGPEVKVAVDLRAGAHAATAWGCDLSYDYVKINADYTSLIVPTADGGVAKDDRLANYSPSFKVSLLVEALSYISRFAGKTCVIKYGGAALVRESLKKAFCDDVNLLRSVGLRPIVVHGGGPEIARTLKKLGRNADEAKVVEMVLTGSINSDIVTLLNRQGGHAVGVSGKDGAFLKAQRVSAGDDKAQPLGDVTQVDKGFLEMLIAQNYVPVIAPVGMGDDGEGYNLSGDQVAAKVAAALGVSKLIYLTDVPGILDGDELVQQLKSSQLVEKLEKGQISGGMTAKARGILEALDAGVPQVHVLDGRTPHSIIAELFTDSGIGTLVTRG